jgi:LuxR family transcriptional regulator, quorum-sensing system regulator CciR
MNLLSLERIESVRIKSPADIRRAAQALHCIGQEFGMRVAPTHNIADKSTPVDLDGNLLARDVFGWDDDEGVWWRNSSLALDSPLTMACRVESEPFWVNLDGFRARLPNPSLDLLDLGNFAARALTQAAIVVPVHMQFGQIGAVSFVPLDPGKSDLSEEFARWGEMFGIYGRSFVVTYAHAMALTQPVSNAPKLSRYEVECLRWAAIGKTDSEISTIMARSRATIRYHLKNAADKLDAVNRSQTVFKATQLGYLISRL